MTYKPLFSLSASLFSLLACTTALGNTFDNAHFYRATNFYGEPRLPRNSLTNIDFSLGGGFTTKGKNACGCTVPLLDIYGTHNMHDLFINVPNQDLTNPLDLILKNLELSPSRDGFANFSIPADFHIFEWYFNFVTNFYKGFFLWVNLPMRRMQITHPCFVDLSPTDDQCPNLDTPVWQQFLNNFDAILARYNLSKDPFRQTTIGDLTVTVGWAYSYHESDQLDYVDVDLQTGVLFPTGKRRNEDQIFSLPTGYNGHWAVPFAGDLSFGTFEWLTIGGHVEAMVFGDRTECIRLKTAPCQSGIITLAKGDAKVKPGPIFIGGAYIKGDHFMRGLSLTIGYSYARKNADRVIPCDTCLTCESVASNDGRFLGWQMQTIHILADYDFTKDGAMAGAHLGFFYNAQIRGERVFNTNMAGALVGVEMLIDF